MRLAMFGPIAAAGASSAKALFGVVECWLRSGHEIDFYSPGSYVDPAHLLGWPNFRYTAVPITSWKRAARQAGEETLRSTFGPAGARSAVAAVLNQAQRVGHEADLAQAIRREHEARRYDAFVMINRTSPYPLADLMPVVSWSQGSPECESEFIRREPELVRGEVGWSGWAFLRAGYVLRDAMSRGALHRSTGTIAASQWGKHMFVRAGVPEDRLRVVPFPVDLTHFKLTPRPGDPRRFTFLWLGRIVPRKRFPLALEAFERLRARRPGVRLVVVGGPGYGGMIPEYHLPPLGPGVERLGNVRPDAVPAILADTDVIFQPSENETFGAAPAEGLATGIPSVIGPTHGTSDVLLDTAFRFERYGAGEIAQAMERAMDAVVADPVGVARHARAVAERTLALPLVAERGMDVVREFIARWHAERGGEARRSAPEREPAAHAGSS